MTNLDIARQRLYNQHLAQRTFERPGDVVAWLGAVQAQDYLGALWAVGLRMQHPTEGAIEQAITDRTIIRTWPMRGTLHFVAPADVRWMLELLTPRVVAGSAGRLKQLGIDDALLARSTEVLVDVLGGGKQLTRPALYKLLARAGIATDGGRGLQILWRLAQSGIICLGARAGKQHTFALLDEWVPAARALDREAALAELARRYFTSHGPAMLHDFVWWSGLATTDARAGLEMARPHLAQEVIDGKTYWLPASVPSAQPAPPTACLLPAYDEYTVAYKDRGAVLDPLYAEQARSAILGPVIILNGQVVGTWKRTLKNDAVAITAHPFAELSPAERRAVAAAADRYAAFLGAPAVVSYG